MFSSTSAPLRRTTGSRKIARGRSCWPAVSSASCHFSSLRRTRRLAATWRSRYFVSMLGVAAEEHVESSPQGGSAGFLEHDDDGAGLGTAKAPSAGRPLTMAQASWSTSQVLPGLRRPVDGAERLVGDQLVDEERRRAEVGFGEEVGGALEPRVGLVVRDDVYDPYKQSRRRPGGSTSSARARHDARRLSRRAGGLPARAVARPARAPAGGRSAVEICRLRSASLVRTATLQPRGAGLAVVVQARERAPVGGPAARPASLGRPSAPLEQSGEGRKASPRSLVSSRGPRPPGPGAMTRYTRMFTARAATRRTVIADRVDCAAISALAERVSGIASVGLNAIPFVSATYK